MKIQAHPTNESSVPKSTAHSLVMSDGTTRHAFTIFHPHKDQPSSINVSLGDWMNLAIMEVMLEALTEAKKNCAMMDMHQSAWLNMNDKTGVNYKG